MVNLKWRKTREKLNKLFEALGEKNLLVRQDFEDCQTCAVSALADELKGTDKRGAVYYHNQDQDGFDEDGVMNIRYFSVGNEDALAIGNDVVAEAEALGMRVRWDGDVHHTIRIDAEEKCPTCGKEMD